MRYRFTRFYQSHLGTWNTGDEAEFDEETAAWLNRDMPGCIEPIETEPKRQQPRPKNRQVRAPKQTRQRKDGDT